MNSSPFRARRWVGVALAVGLVLTTVGCSDDDKDSARRAPAATPTEALWNPCDALQPGQVQRLLGAKVTASTGTPTSPQCSFTPVTDGDPTLNVNYQLFAGTLDELFKTFGRSLGTTVTGVEVPQADAARVVSVVDDGTLAVSGFVQNGELVQLVNAVDPAPFDRARLVGTVRRLLVDLAAHADESGLSEG